MIAVVVGTRPEIIKVAPIIRRMKKARIPYVFLHTNQHYTKVMDADIIRDLQLDPPHQNFGVGSLSHAAQTGRAMEGLESYFLKNRPSIVLVHGDTNTTLAGAMAAKKLNIPVGHVEAGLRSFDQKMPEEINRILVDRISDVHFAPTQVAKQNLLHDGLSEDGIVVCGNSVVDALYDHVALTEKSDVLDTHSLEPDNYILATVHRAENVDTKEELSALLTLLEYASDRTGKKVMFPMHPRTKKNIEQFGLDIPATVQVTDPVGYIDMLALIKNAALVLTDSGGLQEEAYILKRPLITLRDSTERPETLTANFLVKSDIAAFEKAWQAYEKGEPYWEAVFGDGTTSDQIIEALRKYL